MAKSTTALSKQLIGHLANIEKTRRKSEELLRTGKLSDRDVNIIYSGLFLEAVVSFERFLEDLFVDLLSEKVRHPLKRIQPKLSFKSSVLAQDVLLNERQYLDWLPYRKYTAKRAVRFFKSGLPFTGLDGTIESTTDNISVIRNALAHKSAHSLKAFNKKFILSAGGLHSRETTPVGYLRGLHTSHPTDMTRYEQIINDMKKISILLTSKTSRG